MGNQLTLEQAIDSGDYRKIQELLRLTKTIQDEAGKALIYGCLSGDTRLVGLIIQYRKLDVNTAIDNRYPLGYASAKGHSDIVKTLLSNGAKVDAKYDTVKMY